MHLCSQVSCPYSEINLNKEGLLPDRLSGERPLALCGPQPRGRRPDQNANAMAQSSSTPEHQEGAEESQSRLEHRRAGAPSRQSVGKQREGPLKKPRAPLGKLTPLLCMQLQLCCPFFFFWEQDVCVARKPGPEEAAERPGSKSQPEPPGGGSEQSHNGPRPKRYRGKASKQTVLIIIMR